MNEEILIERLFQALIAGDRVQARGIVEEAREDGFTAEDLTHLIYWPTSEMLCRLYRADQISTLAHHYATRLLLMLVTQAQAGYAQHEPRDRKVLLFCGAGDTDELAGQIVGDLLEADGYEVYFGGGGIAGDEILMEVGRHQPDILLLFASAASDAPDIRCLIDTIREIGACAKIQIVAGGGVFSRAQGLAEEIGADLWADDPFDLLRVLTEQRDRRATPDQRTVGRSRLRRDNAA